MSDGSDYGYGQEATTTTPKRTTSQLRDLLEAGTSSARVVNLLIRDAGYSLGDAIRLVKSWLRDMAEEAGEGGAGGAGGGGRMTAAEIFAREQELEQLRAPGEAQQELARLAATLQAKGVTSQEFLDALSLGLTYDDLQTAHDYGISLDQLAALYSQYTPAAARDLLAGKAVTPQQELQNLYETLSARGITPQEFLDALSLGLSESDVKRAQSLAVSLQEYAEAADRGLGVSELRQAKDLGLSLQQYGDLLRDFSPNEISTMVGLGLSPAEMQASFAAGVGEETLQFRRAMGLPILGSAGALPQIPIPAETGFTRYGQPLGTAEAGQIAGAQAAQLARAAPQAAALTAEQIDWQNVPTRQWTEQGQSYGQGVRAGTRAFARAPLQGQFIANPYTGEVTTQPLLTSAQRAIVGEGPGIFVRQPSGALTLRTATPQEVSYIRSAQTAQQQRAESLKGPQRSGETGEQHLARLKEAYQAGATGMGLVGYSSEALTTPEGKAFIAQMRERRQAAQQRAQSMAKGGKMTIPEPSFVIGQSGKVYATLAEGGKAEKVTVAPLRRRKFQYGGTINVLPTRPATSPMLLRRRWLPTELGTMPFAVRGVV